MSNSVFIHKLRLANFLSFGGEGQTVELGPLNVLIGPNAAGKSNLIEALGLLQAAPGDLADCVRKGGGIGEWIWKGGDDGESRSAEIEAVVSPASGTMPLRHRLAFAEVGQRFEITDEVVEDETKKKPSDDDVYFYYRYQHGQPALNVRMADGASEPEQNGFRRFRRRLQREDIRSDKSILAQKRDADVYPELTHLAARYESFRLYKEWFLGRDTAPRRPQQADLPEDHLEPDASNLGLVLNGLEHGGKRQEIQERLQTFYPDIEQFSNRVHGGTVQIFLHEKSLKRRPVPATRLSDGTLRYLCLLAILCHPRPPPVVCIEEPELGLHPDILPTIGELLRDASQRTQLIVTTHSDALVSALGDTPESVLVCERKEEGTRIRRLRETDLKEWLEKYTLGELWTMGEIGGTRW